MNSPKSQAGEQVLGCLAFQSETFIDKRMNDQLLTESRSAVQQRDQNECPQNGRPYRAYQLSSELFRTNPLEEVRIRNLEQSQETDHDENLNKSLFFAMVFGEPGNTAKTDI